MLRRISCFTIFVTLFFVAACESYDFKVNEQLVYTAKPLFSDFDTQDPALYECLKQGIVDQKISTVSQLSTLSCSHAGISDLQGLAIFTGLTRLKLSANQIRNLAAISALSSLEELYLDDNLVIDPVPLYQLTTLRLLDLSGNTALQCPDASAFSLLESLTLPDHCN